jgi:type I restriction enzyme, S subunit
MSSKTKTNAAEEEAKPALVPKLRFPEFRKAEGWKERPLGDFLSESRLPGSKGNVAKKITVKLWGNGVFEKNDAIQGSINTQYFRRKSGQFIYSKLDFLNQAFGIIPPSLDNFESTVDLPCFDFADGLNSVFLLEYVKRRDFYERLGETADGSRKARRIHAETFLSFPIALPTAAEQQKIAECLSSVDELMAAQVRKVDALKTHKKGLMQQLFPRPERIENGVKIPAETQPRLRFREFQGAGEWGLKTLEDIAEIRSGTTPLRSNPAFFTDGTIPWVKTTDLNNSFILSTEEKITPIAKARVNPTGSVLVAMYGGFNQIGRTGCLSMPAATNQAISVLVLDRAAALPVYVLAWLNAKIEVWKRIASSSRKDPNITGADVAKFPITLPSLEEQHRIADWLTTLDALITAETQKLDALKTHKKGLMQQLFPSAEVVEA